MTGIAAVLAAIAGVLTAVANGTPIDWSSAISAIIAGVGLIAARDHNVTSESAGAK